MKKLRIFLLAVATILGLSVPVFADSDVDYSISNYDGVLAIHDDNAADFYQTITYRFDSSYNGQVVTLGEAGHMPEGFSVNNQPEVSAEVNGVSRTVRPVVNDLGDGYQVKIYNSGSSGDIVTVKLHWKLSHLLFPYQDVAELNWVPISDWDETLRHVTFTVLTDKTTANRKLWAHRGYLKSVTVEKLPDGYRITAENVDGKLELHAYWDKTILTTPATIASKRKAAIIKQEAKIARKKAISDNQEQIRNKKNNITEQIDAIKKAMYKEYLKNNVYVFMNDSVFSTILDKAYDESHSEGMDEVYCTFDELVDFVGDIMYSVKNNIIQY